MSKLFDKPDNLYVNTPAPESIKKLIISKIVPAPFVKPFLSALFLLFLSPLLLLFIPSFLNERILLPVIATVSSLFVLFSLLSGLIFTQLKSPYLQELKEKFGYIEK